MVEDLCEPEVNQLEIALRVEHHILEFNVPVDYPAGMKVVYGEDLEVIQWMKGLPVSG